MRLGLGEMWGRGYVTRKDLVDTIFTSPGRAFGITGGDGIPQDLRENTNLMIIHATSHISVL